MKNSQNLDTNKTTDNESEKEELGQKAIFLKEEKPVTDTVKRHGSSNEKKSTHSHHSSHHSSHHLSHHSSHHSSHRSRHSSGSHSSHSSGHHHSGHRSGHRSSASNHKSENSEQNTARSSRDNAPPSVIDDSAGTERHIKKRYSFSVQNDTNIPVAVYHKRKEHKQEEPQESKKKLSKRFKIFIGFASSIIAFLLVIVITFSALLINGKSALIGQNNNVTISPPAGAMVEGEYIVYNNHKYKYNNKVTSILLSGIDMHTEEHQEGVLGTAGQADTILVLALNTETGKYKVFSVSRDTMVDVNICDQEGNFTGYEEMQLCLAHAYGGGAELSNENLKRSVSRIFYGIPMNSYMSIDLDAIPVLNDAVGGVTVTVVEDLSHYNSKLTKGATVTLKGDLAEIYVRSRDIEGDANQNDLRMKRQESYLEAFIHQVIFQTKHNIRTPLNLYSEATPYARTDIDASRVTYLASILMETGFSTSTNYVKVPGEAVAGKEFAEYYVDTDRFFKMILDTYFIKVD
ncbi:MAG: LCP family protein [Acutalibacteraceae bacterium]|nr:LCP family protein [Acutalibacteraceae bacterium]